MSENTPKFKPLFILLLIGINQNANAQLHKTIDSLQAIEQSCLDSGINMNNCLYNFRHQMDSILNVVYNSIRSNLNSTQKEKLKNEEVAWLKKRKDNYHESYIESTSIDIRGAAGMMACKSDANFIIDRIYSIIKKWDFKKMYSN